MWRFRMWREQVTTRVALQVAWLLPRRVVTHAYCRVGAHATTGRYSGTVVPDLSMMDALQRWED